MLVLKDEPFPPSYLPTYLIVSSPLLPLIVFSLPPPFISLEIPLSFPRRHGQCSSFLREAHLSLHVRADRVTQGLTAPPSQRGPPTDSLSIIATPLVLFSRLSVPPPMQLGFPHPPAGAALVQSIALPLSLYLCSCLCLCLCLCLGPLSPDSVFSIC